MCKKLRCSAYAHACVLTRQEKRIRRKGHDPMKLETEVPERKELITIVGNDVMVVYEVGVET